MNDQEAHWKGPEGSAYTKRNRVAWTKRIPFWKSILEIADPSSVLDVGCNAGWNLLALRSLNRHLYLRGVDLNVDALVEACGHNLDAREVGASEVGTLWPRRFDLVVTSGVLIHVAPQYLGKTMESIVRASKEWVLAVEYEAEQEESVVYRGVEDRLWKRPFGRLYEDMGLKLEMEVEAEGFDRCKAWLLRK